MEDVRPGRQVIELRRIFCKNYRAEKNITEKSQETQIGPDPHLVILFCFSGWLFYACFPIFSKGSYTHFLRH